MDIARAARIDPAWRRLPADCPPELPVTAHPPELPRTRRNVGVTRRVGRASLLGWINWFGR